MLVSIAIYRILSSTNQSKYFQLNLFQNCLLILPFAGVGDGTMVAQSFDPSFHVDVGGNAKYHTANKDKNKP